MAQIKNRRRKSLTIFLAALLTMAGAGIAFAYWTAQGEGVGTAQTGTSVAFDITSAAPVGVLAPGSAGQTVEFTVTNPSEGNQQLTEVSVVLADADGTPWAPTGGCLVADYSVSVTTAPTYGTIAPGDSVTGTATVLMANTLVNQDACQGQEVPLFFSTNLPV